MVSDPADVSCVCARLRMAARVVTRVYDDALRPSGLGTNQFSLLARLDDEGPLALGRLADRLAMDRTTVARDVAVLARRSLVAVEPGRDRRRRVVSLTDAGRERLAAAYPLWRSVQADVRSRLGRERTAGLLDELGAVVQAARAVPHS